jgi:type 2 lantibiotic biosynthesis protein LanM
MGVLDLGDPTWYRALSFVERHSVLEGALSVDTPSSHEAARLLLAKRSLAVEPDVILTARAREDALTEKQVADILAADPRSLTGRSADLCQWLGFLDQGLSTFDERVVIEESADFSDVFAILEAITPLIAAALERLVDELRCLSPEQSSLRLPLQSAAGLFMPALERTLLRAVTPTLVLELNVARLRGLLVGSSGTERFQSFLTYMRHPQHLANLLREYPVLARLVSILVEDWLASSLELIRALLQDHAALGRVFNRGCDLGSIIAVSGDLGDRHHGGRSVTRVSFSSGVSIIYKPRSVAVDAHFQDLLAWLNEHGQRPSFRTYLILDRGAHGWCEDLRPESCPTLASLRRFYRRQGGYVALLYALAGADCHYDNIIAVGEHPMLIDLEALFHPRFIAGGDASAQEVVLQHLDDSVMQSLLLPRRMGAGPDSDGIEIGGLDGGQTQITPWAVPALEAIGSDHMRIEDKRVGIPEGVNRPRYDGVQAKASRYGSEVVTGFLSTYALLQQLQAKLLASDGPIARFEEDEVRVILRPTRLYETLISDSLHPDTLRDALDREILIDWLWSIDAPYLGTEIIRAERAAVRCCDVPYFRTKPGSRDLWVGTTLQARDSFPESGMGRVRKRIDTLGPDDLEKQLWILRASLATTGAATGPRRVRRSRRPAPTEITKERLITAAGAVADRLLHSAVVSCGEASWLGLLQNGDTWSVGPVGQDLYGGLSGIAFFLGYAGAIMNRNDCSAASEAAVETVRRRLQNSVSSVGGYTGLGGILYALTHLAYLWTRSDLLREACVCSKRISELIDEDDAYDVIGGAAGCIKPILGLYGLAQDRHLLRTARRCGQHLLHYAQWGDPLRTRRSGLPVWRLTGFGHGAAGVAWALLHLAATTSDQRFRDGALRGIDYERQLFSPAAGNWPDLRKLPTESSEYCERNAFMTAWCHGAVGIGLARLDTRAWLDAKADEEIRIALTTTIREGFGDNDSLCHGAMGNVDFLIKGSAAVGDGTCDAAAKSIVSEILDRVGDAKWRCATPDQVESPGLMTGLAGLGLGLLRLAAPGVVPSVLTLDAPLKP